MILVVPETIEQTKPTRFQPNGRPRTWAPGNRGLEQSYRIRDFAAAEIVALENLVTKNTQERLARARAVADMTRVWETACERIRILKGRPLPGSLRPAAKPKTRSKSIGAVEVKPVASDPPATPAPPGIEAKPGE